MPVEIILSGRFAARANPIRLCRMLPGSNKPPPRTVDPTMRTDELDFDLPPELIAQEPLPQRPASRLMHYRRSGRAGAPPTFSDPPQLLRPRDPLAFNNPPGRP